jgi:hypothetical protein
VILRRARISGILNRLPVRFVELGADGQPDIVVEAENVGRQSGAQSG